MCVCAHVSVRKFVYECINVCVCVRERELHLLFLISPPKAAREGSMPTIISLISAGLRERDVCVCEYVCEGESELKRNRESGESDVY